MVDRLQVVVFAGLNGLLLLHLLTIEHAEPEHLSGPLAEILFLT